MLTRRTLVGGALACFAASTAAAQEHEHGVGDIPDWYDPACCNKQDCRPVPDEEVEFFSGDDGKGALRHLPSGLVFPAAKWRPSQDERYHVCFRNVNGDQFDPYWIVYCAYIRAGV